MISTCSSVSLRLRAKSGERGIDTARLMGKVSVPHCEFHGRERPEHHRLVEVAKVSDPEHFARQRSEPLPKRQIVLLKRNPPEMIGIDACWGEHRSHGIGNPAWVGAQKFEPFDRAGRPAEEWPRVQEALQRMRPLAADALLASFQLAMDEATEQALGEMIRRDSERGESG